jgi:thioredoxin 1
MAEGMTARGVIAAVILAAAVFAAGAWTVQSWRQPVTAAGLPADTVQAALRQGKPAIVEFGSKSCYNCREMQRILAELTRDYGGRVSVATVDVLANREYISRYGIQAIPTQVFYDAEGRETGRHMGIIAAEDILLQLGLDPAAKKGES